ncbi:hypothetical protein D3C84_461640 [compost metagenome]
MQQRDHQWPLLILIEQPPHQVGALVAIEHRGKQLDAQCRVLAHPIGQALAQFCLEATQVAFKIGIRHIERIVVEDLREHARQRTLRAIHPRLRRTLVAAHGRPGGMDEHAAITDQVMTEQPAEDRVVPGFGQLIVQAQVDQADIGALDQRPQRHIQQRLLIETIAQPASDFADFLFVQVDARGRGALGRLPVSLLEPLARAVGDLAKVLPVIIEAIEDLASDISGRPLLGHNESSAGCAKA